MCFFLDVRTVCDRVQYFSFRLHHAISRNVAFLLNVVDVDCIVALMALGHVRIALLALSLSFAYREHKTTFICQR